MSTVHDVAKAETMIGFELPAELRRYYLADGMTRPDPDCYVRDGTIYVINSIFTVQIGRPGSLATMWRDYSPHLPTGLIPFANDPCGNVFCISVSRDHLGSIWYFDIENDEETRSAARFIADSFDELMSGLLDGDEAERLAEEPK